jgi:hypothetical protein
MLRALKRRIVEMMEGSNKPAWKASLVIFSTTLLLSEAKVILAYCSGGFGPWLYNWIENVD